MDGVTFARVTAAWARCHISKPKRANIVDVLAAHGRAKCNGGPTLPFIGQVNIGGSVRIRCLFDKYEFEFECDPALALVRVLRIAYHRVVDRRSTLADNPSLQSLPFLHPRDLLA